MPLDTAILKTIHDSGYIIRKRHKRDKTSESGEIHTVEAQDLRDGHRYVVMAPTFLGAATELAIKLGFNLEG